MKKENFRKHFGIFMYGFIHALKGTMATALIAAAVLMFRRVLMAGGYLAVVMFIAGIAEVFFSLLLFYWCGRDLLNGKYSK